MLGEHCCRRLQGVAGAHLRVIATHGNGLRATCFWRAFVCCCPAGAGHQRARLVQLPMEADERIPGRQHKVRHGWHVHPSLGQFLDSLAACRHQHQQDSRDAANQETQQKKGNNVECETGKIICFVQLPVFLGYIKISKDLFFFAAQLRHVKTCCGVAGDWQAALALAMHA